MPVSECNRRSVKEIPFPARRGATPGFVCIAPVELALEATATLPEIFQDEGGTFYYVVPTENNQGE